MSDELSPRERALLDFERDWAAHQGGKADAIRSHFAISTQRYYQLLNRLIHRPAALAADPLTVRRLRRRRQRRLTAQAPARVPDQRSK